MKAKESMLMVVLAMIACMNTLANGIVNPSFEDDAGGIFSVTFDGAPAGWEADLPSNFDAKVDTDWSTNGIYSLTIFARARAYYAFEEATISQDVNVTDYNNLVFDLQGIARRTSDINDWDGSKVTAFVAIDGNTVWESPNDLDVSYNNIIDISNYRGTVNLSLGIRVSKLSETFKYAYWSMWDNVRLTNDTVFLPCGGNGYLNTDLNFDCNVDFDDLIIIINNWLIENFNDMPPYGQLIDLDGSGKVNFVDYSMVVGDIGLTTDATSLAAVQGDYAPLTMDVNFDADNMTDGTVNFIDYAQIMADTNDIDALIKIADQWLQIAPPNKK